ncbi:ArsC/Spx/MgsR family protein [Couchioplanes caeruleus]|uniref:Arsenate reductase n=2 Tax=Couchioplanes caeruleus TaxID=56438 RepID=A0A1K0FQ20_9ACTN|nr:ArsC/Spx/MgsR family protein [Couchioplanes caeruleus]OJF14941.1 arsenate reductase [Couchioplanes caeruleus subsp. caeruleus]ROP30455.1 arsenate reductase [Couchioplanes caeruleus]
MEIWINPECSKCHAATDMLDAAGASYTVRRYLDEPPSEAELESVLARLGLQPWHIARLAEPAAVAMGMDSWPQDEESRPRWIDALLRNPALIQRPIITTDDGAATLGRTPEAIRAILPTGQPR